METRALLLGCVGRRARIVLRLRTCIAPNCGPADVDTPSRSAARGFIFSALYGLLEPDQLVDPYDLALTNLAAGDRRRWGEHVVAELAARLPLDGAVLEVHAGSAYRKAIAEPLRRRGARINVPLAGLRLGQQLAWYASAEREHGRRRREDEVRPVR